MHQRKQINSLATQTSCKKVSWDTQYTEQQEWKYFSFNQVECLFFCAKIYTKSLWYLIREAVPV